MASQLPDISYKLTDTENRMSQYWYNYFLSQNQMLNPGISTTIATAKLTGGGANGSMTFTNGILTAQTQAT